VSGNAIASHALDALKGSRLEGASKEYVAELFDSYSASFDASLAALQYKSPFLLRKAVDAFLATEEGKELNLSNWRVLDAGCGTGLSGADFRNISCRCNRTDIV
jgi:predicted TPR repeat methyltransferase